MAKFAFNPLHARNMDVINDHREATGHRKLSASRTSPDRAQHHLGLIEEHAPYGNDPWGNDNSEKHERDYKASKREMRDR